MAALVEPGPELTSDQVQRYSRHVLVPEIGVLGQRRLGAARVAVVGAGGLGSPVLTYLAAAGVGTLGVIDHDVVDVSNLQRQTIHRSSSVGMAKTASAAAALAEVNPLVLVRQHHVQLTAANASQILQDYDLVVDGSDNFPTRYLVSDTAAALQLPVVWGSILQFDGQASVFWAGRGPTYRDLHPTPPPPGSVLSCGEAGVLGVVCSTIGSVMATEAIKLICGLGRPLLGRVLIYDALDGSSRMVDLRPRPAASAWSGSAAAQPQPEAGRAIDPVPVAAVSPSVLRSWIGTRPVTVVDVREPAEHQLGTLPGAWLVPLSRLRERLEGAGAGDDLTGALQSAAESGELVVYCKSGQRSEIAVGLLRECGIESRHLTGGILGWIDSVDPSLPRY